MVHEKNTCKLEFADQLWLPFIYQLKSYVVVFEINSFHIYIILVTKWKHGISPNYIIKFDKEL